MANVRMRIAAGATVLGLGGLAGYALGSNDGPPASAAGTPAALHQKPKVHKQVVHRTVNVHPKGKAAALAGASPRRIVGGPGGRTGDFVFRFRTGTSARTSPSTRGDLDPGQQPDRSGLDPHQRWWRLELRQLLRGRRWIGARE